MGAEMKRPNVGSRLNRCHPRACPEDPFFRECGGQRRRRRRARCIVGGLFVGAAPAAPWVPGMKPGMTPVGGARATIRFAGTDPLLPTAKLWGAVSRAPHTLQQSRRRKSAPADYQVPFTIVVGTASKRLETRRTPARAADRDLCRTAIGRPPLGRARETSGMCTRQLHTMARSDEPQPDSSGMKPGMTPVGGARARIRFAGIPPMAPAALRYFAMPPPDPLRHAGVGAGMTKVGWQATYLGAHGGAR